jgi:hypothetical protein
MTLEYRGAMIILIYMYHFNVVITIFSKKTKEQLSKGIRIKNIIKKEKEIRDLFPLQKVGMHTPSS